MTQTMEAASLVTRQDEFVGQTFYGTGKTAKGAFVSARFVSGARKVDVTFESETAFGPVDVVTYAAARSVHVGD